MKEMEKVFRNLKKVMNVVQAIVFKQTGNYIKYQEELLKVVLPNEQSIIKNFLNLKNSGTVDFSLMSETLFDWAKKWISENR